MLRLLTAQAIVKMMKSTFDTWYTGTRPYISEKGAMTRGPAAYPRMYTG
jgi:hypothetical protein